MEAGSRYKAQRHPTRRNLRSRGWGGDGGSSITFADRLVQRYHDKETGSKTTCKGSSSNKFLGRYQPAKTYQRSVSKYEIVGSELHGHGNGASSDQLWTSRCKRRRELIFASCVIFFILVILVSRRRDEIRIKFPGMPEGASMIRWIRRQQPEQQHVVQRQEFREEDRPRAQRRRKKSPRKSGFQNLHLRVPSNGADTDIIDNAQGIEPGTEGILDTKGSRVIAMDVINADANGTPNKLSPEQNPNDPDAPAVFGMSYFKDTTEKYSKTDIPVFWHGTLPYMNVY